MPVTIGAIAAGASALGELGWGIGKSAKGSRMRKKAQSFFEANKYQIPTEAQTALDIAQRQASGYRMPGQDIAEQRLGQSTAQGVQAARQSATTPSQLLASLTGMYGNQMQQEQNLAMQAAQNYQSRQAALQNQLGNMAQYENQKWQYNVLYPYEQQMQAAGQLSGAGQQMIGAGISGLGQTAMGFSQAYGAQSQWNQQWQQPSQGQQPIQPWMSSNQYWGQ